MTTLHPGGRIAARVAAGAAVGVIVIGMAVLAGWLFGIERLMTVLPGSIRMKPNTAIALIAAAVAVVPIALGAAFVQPRLNFGEMRLGLALSVMTSVIAIVALIASLARSLSSSDRQLLDAERTSTMDDLTGIHNRRYFGKRLDDELTRSARSGAPLSMILSISITSRTSTTGTDTWPVMPCCNGWPRSPGARWEALPIYAATEARSSPSSSPTRR